MHTAHEEGASTIRLLWRSLSLALSIIALRNKEVLNEKLKICSRLADGKRAASPRAGWKEERVIVLSNGQEVARSGASPTRALPTRPFPVGGTNQAGAR